MPLIQIRRNPYIVFDNVMNRLTEALPAVAAKALSSPEGGILAPEAIMLEVDDLTMYRSLNKNCKALHVRVWAHDYPSRRGKDLETLDAIRKQIAEEVVKHLPEGVSWYVWVLLAPTSYGSDTEG